MLKVPRHAAEELLANYIEQGQRLRERAGLIGDSSDYESWKPTRKLWIDQTAEALEQIYEGSGELESFKNAAAVPAGGLRWQAEYHEETKCVQAAIDVLISLRGRLEAATESGGDAEAPRQDPQPDRTQDSPAAQFAQESAYEPERAEGPADWAGAETPPPVAAQEPAGSVVPQDPPGSVAEEETLASPAPQDPAEPVVAHDSRGPAVGDGLGGPAVGQPVGPVAAEEPLGSVAAAEEPVASIAAQEPVASVAAQEPMASVADEEPVASFAGEEPLHADLAAPSTNGSSTSSLPAPKPKADPARQVFLVHGANETWKQAVAGLLERAGPNEVTILNEQPGDRKLLVERLEGRSAGSPYAVVLLTADDVGASRLDDREPYYSPRAHQRVVFEMGVLVAALTPRCVCVLYEDGVELPCDIDGIAYVRLDLAGAWQHKLLLQLRGAGFDYDLNTLAPV